MTKLVVVLAVVVVVILVVVIVAVRNMRAEDPDEFADHDGRGRTRGNRDGHDPRYGRRDSADLQPVRSSRGARPPGHSPAGRQGADGYRPASAGRQGLGDRSDQRGRGYDQRPQNGSGYGMDQDFDDRPGRLYDDRRSAAEAAGPEKGPRGSNGTHRPDEARTPARPRRRSSDSSEWDSSEWDKLSDIDYWTELASDKSLTTKVQPAAQPRHPAAQSNGAQVRPGADREPDTLAVPSSVPRGAPRRDPVTGLPVRGSQQPADPGLEAAASRAGFASAPIPAESAQDRQDPAAASAGDRGRTGHRRRPPVSPNGDRARSDRQRPPSSRNGDRGRQDRERLLTAPVSDPGQRLLDAPNGDPGGYLSAGPASLPLPAIRDVPPARQARPRDVPPARQARPRDIPPARQDRPSAAADDDPLTSPSFPKIPADGRSYRNGRADTPPGGSPAPASYLDPTQQFASYDSPAAQYPPPQRPAQYQPPQRPAQYPAAQRSAPLPPQQPAPQHPAAQYPAPRQRGNGSGDPDGTNPHAYRPDPLASRNPYPAQASPASPGPAPMPTGPAPASNPYGSYVTPDSQQTVASSYDDYPAAPGNGHPEAYPPPAVPGGIGPTGNGYWHQEPSAPSLPDPGAPRYLDGAVQAGDPRDADEQGADYRNGYGQQGQAGYPAGYPAVPRDPAGYAPVDPYGSDGYDGYPEYGAAGR